MMRRGAKANAITNSPIVRALINPVFTKVPPRASPAATSESDGPVASTSTAHLLPTQPDRPAPGEEEQLVSKKRAHEAIDSSDSSDSSSSDSESEDEVPAKRPGETVRYSADTLPAELKKYWPQRYRLWSKYDQGVEMDIEGWYSVTPEKIAAQIAERCRCGTVVDAFCGVGGNAIQFALTCERVIAIDTSLTRLACARHNAELYGVADHIRFVHADFVQWARDLATKKNVPSIGPSDPWDDVEVVFLSPPWGGVDYMRERAGTALANKSLAKPANVYTLETLAPLPGKELMSLSRQLTPHVALYVPRNTDLKELGELVNDGEKAEVEEERMNGKVKALTVYFGELASLPEA